MSSIWYYFSTFSFQNLKADDLACANWTYVLIVTSVAILITIGTLLLVTLIVYKCKQKSRSPSASPCFHIKDDTMIYSRAATTMMNYHQNPLDSESSTYAKAILQGSYSPPSTEPLYEVPKYSNNHELGIEDQPKSSSTTGSSSKYSSSGYVGSELWESDFLGHNGNATPIVMNFGTQRSPRSSSGMGSTNSSTGSSGTGTKPVFYSPGRNPVAASYYNHTLVNGSGNNSPAKYSMFMSTNTNGSPKYPPSSLHHQQHHLVSGTSIRSPRNRPIHNAYVWTSSTIKYCITKNIVFCGFITSVR